MPAHRMHMTTLEVVFSKTPNEIAAVISRIKDHIVSITSYTYTHRARLVKPMISYDSSAFALSFIPAASEPILSPSPVPPGPVGRITEGDAYTYHHLRGDLFDAVRAAGVDVTSRYQVPSAHITLGRFVTQKDHETLEARARWIDAIEKVNQWLVEEIWDRKEAALTGEWIVGQEKGLDARCGALWYGGGRTINLGEGF
jgi:hypothetical protein